MMKQENKGIWKYNSYLPKVDQKFQLTLGEGNTEVVYKDGIYFKCEHKNPTGSVKDRAVCYQIAVLKESGQNNAVISSSGNAAISASVYSRLFNINLTAFVSPGINPNKLSAIDKGTKIIKSKKPVSSAFKYSIEKKIKNLRQSRDKYGSTGYRTISYELSEINRDIDAVFVPVSGGSILKGVYEGFAQLNLFPRVNAVQTTKIHPLGEQFDTNFKSEDSSLSDAIVARFLPLEDELIKIIKKSGGWAWVISNLQMEKARKKLQDLSLNVSYEAAAVLAAFYKAVKEGKKYSNPVCILSGKDYP